MSEKLNIYQRADLAQLIIARANELKIGQVIKVLDNNEVASLSQNLTKAKAAGGQYAIISISEDIGPRANYGRPGAKDAPQAFLKYFLNMQANHFFDCSKVILVGEIAVDDLMKKSMEEKDCENLRNLCSQLDERVAAVVNKIAAAGLEIIVIGGGNNNSFPIIKGVFETSKAKDKNFSLAVANCDSHADFRPLEGRHSGNPFSYAYEHGYLKNYCVFALQESQNSQETLSALEKAGFPSYSFEEFAIKRTISFSDSLDQLQKYLKETGLSVGCELDLDSIKNMPSSAQSPLGLTEEEAACFIWTIASQFQTNYLHLSEGAPELDHTNGERQVGKCLATLTMTYLKARRHFHSF